MIAECIAERGLFRRINEETRRSGLYANQSGDGLDIAQVGRIEANEAALIGETRIVAQQRPEHGSGALHLLLWRSPPEFVLHGRLSCCR